MPSVQRPDPFALLLAIGAAALAGATDVTGLSRLKDVFVSFMSGNTTLLGLAIGQADGPRVALIGGVIALFVAGAALGSILSEATGSYHAAWVMSAVTLLLAVPLLRDAWTVPMLILAMGALNDAMGKIGETSVGLTYVTGALVKFGSGAGRWLVKRGAPGGWPLQGVMWLSLLAGAVAAAVFDRQTGAPPPVWPLPVLAALLVPLCALRGRRPARPS